MTFAQKLDGLLTEHDLSVLSLTYLLGVHPATVYSWFRHEAEPDTETVCRIAKILHCGKEELFQSVDHNRKGKHSGGKQYASQPRP